jgi:hypothetical protein
MKWPINNAGDLSMRRMNSQSSGLAAGLAVAFVAVAALKFAGAHAASAAAHQPPAAAPAYPTIVRVVGRDLTVTISAGPRHTLYSATDAKGVVLASNVTLDELRDRHPDVYKQVQPALCVDAGDLRKPATTDGVWAGTD